MNQNKDQRPNILWISLEDTSPRFGCYGDTLARTPNIDRLASEGRRYPNAFATAGVCAPSRSSIITGMYQTSIGTHHMRTSHTNPHTPELPTPYEAVPPPYVKAFTEYLRAQGYYCVNNQKTDYQFNPPVTAWDECGGKAHFRNRPSQAQPFFAVFNTTITHESGMWPREDGTPETDPNRVQLPPYLPDTMKVREALARHYDNIAQADRYTGKILQQLQEDGLDDNTIVFLWSDHGEGLPRGKRWTYDAGIRVPLIVRWPGQLEPGSVSEQLVSMIDLGPTVLSLCGVTVPQHLQGQPFLDQHAADRTYIYAARDRYDESYDMVRAVRDKRYKYIRNYYPNLPYLLWIPYRNRHPILQEMQRLYLEDKLEGPEAVLFQNGRPAEELYDCVKDPFELNNLAEDPGFQETLLRMRCALDDWRDRYGDLGDEPEEQMVFRMWQGMQQPATAAPIIIPISPSLPGNESAGEGGKYEGPLLLQLHCATQGASIAYTTEEGEHPHWQLYTEPLRLSSGRLRLRVKAIRIGYHESEEQKACFEIIE